MRSAEPSSRRARSERRLSPIRNQSARADVVLQRNSAKVDPAESDTKASSNRPPLPAKATGKPPKNRALQQKLQELEREAGEQQQREARFKRRQQQVKRALSEQKAQREEGNGTRPADPAAQEQAELKMKKDRAEQQRKLSLKRQVEEQNQKKKEEAERIQKEKEELEKRQRRE